MMLSSTRIEDDDNSNSEDQQSLDDSLPSDNDVMKNVLNTSISNLQADQENLSQQVFSDRQRMQNDFKAHIEQLSQFVAQESEERNVVQSVLEMWHIAVQEIEYLEKTLSDKTSGKEFEEKIAEVKAEYSKALTSLSEELALARIELRTLQNDLQGKNRQLEEDKKIIENVTVHLAKKEKQLNDAVVKERNISARVMALEANIAENRKALEEKNDEMFSLRQKFDELLASDEELKRQNADLKSQKLAAQKDAKESLLTTEKAVLDKEEAVYKEQQALKEIQFLKGSINQVVEQTASKYKVEIQDMERQFNEKIQTMLKEIQTFEMENKEKQNLYERATRDKDAAESELRSLYEKNANGSPVSNSVLEDFCRKLTAVERAKNEIELEAQALHTSLKDMKLSHEQEVQLLQDECKRMRSRLQNLQADFNDILSSRVQLTDEIELLKKRCQKAEKEAAGAKSSNQNDIYMLEQKLQKKHQTFLHQLQITEERHKRAVTELQHLLDAQYDINNRWKEEVQELTAKFESKIKDLYEDNVRLYHQNEELSRTLQQKQAGDSLAEYLPPYGSNGNPVGTIYGNR